MTEKLYLDDPYRRLCDADVLAVENGWSLLSRTVFYPGGGGQPPDRGHLQAGEMEAPVAAVRMDDTGGIWHSSRADLSPGRSVTCTIDWPYRYALMRHHALMHIVNNVALKEFGGLITGVQLGPVRSRIDFRFTAFDRTQLAAFEAGVNAIVDRDLTISSAVIGVDELSRRPELIRTANVLPPEVDGLVRIVEVAGFDSQACGGTHVHSTGEIGAAHIIKFDNKGKENKRLYWSLSPLLEGGGD
ncbi:MAG: alanyl-tRNA editing protein [Acidimicrobiia bacterium]|nr:alanyl-tRNA editing protein [Acidimicrobiia bacterium]